MDFEEWFESLDLDNWTNKKYMHDAFEAGQQSRQAEIDALEAKINRALKALEKLDGYDYNEDLDSVFLILGE